MDTSLVQNAVMILLGVLGWFMKRTIDAQEKRIEKLEKENVDIRKEYLHKDDFKEFKTELRGMFEEIKSDIRVLRDKHV
jgi:hypothetical protein